MRHHCWRLVAQGTNRYPKTRSLVPGSGAGGLLAGVVTSHSLCYFGQGFPPLTFPRLLPHLLLKSHPVFSRPGLLGSNFIWSLFTSLAWLTTVLRRRSFPVEAWVFIQKKLKVV